LVDDQRKILDMLSEGKIGVDDAERLLQAVSGRSNAAVTHTEARERVEVRVEPPIEDREPDEREDAFTVGESPRLVVDVDKGRVAVGVGPPGEIRVRATTGGPSRVAYEVSQHGDEVRVSVRKKSRKLLFGFVDLGRDGRVNIEVTTPAATDVNARLGTGPMVLVGVDGASSLHTAAGRISVEDASGTLDAAAITGQVIVDRFRGSAKLSSTTGKIDVKRSSGEFQADVVSGVISFEGEMTAGGKNKMSAITGGITISLAGEPNLEIDASCVTGRVACDVPGFVSSEATRGHVGSHVKGTVGTGDTALRVSTITGSVRIEHAQDLEGGDGP
jgi:DUF4097 and DUF4098 domain-containing protein YvlB